MSVVTNAILYLGNSSKDALAAVNEFFQHQRGFVSVKDPILPEGWYGGSKYLEADLAIGAFNHLDINGLIRHLCNLNCISHPDAQLIIKEQEKSRFRIINIVDEMTQEEKDRWSIVPEDYEYR